MEKNISGDYVPSLLHRPWSSNKLFFLAVHRYSNILYITSVTRRWHCGICSQVQFKLYDKRQSEAYLLKFKRWNFWILLFWFKIFFPPLDRSQKLPIGNTHVFRPKLTLIYNASWAKHSITFWRVTPSLKGIINSSLW